MRGVDAARNLFALNITLLVALVVPALAQDAGTLDQDQVKEKR